MAETIRGINIKLGLDGSELDAELKSLNTSLKEQNKDLKAINNELKYDSSNVELLTKKQSLLNETLKDTKAKLDAQNKVLIEAKKSLALGDISESEFKKVERSVQYTSAEISKLNNELAKTSEQLNKVASVNFEKVSKIGSSLTKYLTLPIIGASSALVGLSVKSAKVADEFADSAAKIGLSAEALQEWNHVALISGTSSEVIEKAFIKVNALLGDISTGKVEQASSSLSKLGLTVDDLKNIGADEAFSKLQVALSKVTGEATRVGIANEIFGDKIATELIPILSSETDSINKLRNEARELGIVSNEQAKIAGEFTDALDRTKQALSSVAMEISALLLPALTSIVNYVKDTLVPSLSGLVEKWNSLSDGQQKVILSLVGLTAIVGPVLSIVGKMGSAMNMLSISLHGTGTSGFFASAGINAATLGLAALVTLIATALLSSEEFQQLLMELAKSLMDLARPLIGVVDILLNALQPIFNVIIELVIMLIDLLMPLLDLILIPLQFILKVIGDLLKPLLPLIETLAELLNAVLVPILELILTIVEPIFELITGVVNAISSAGNWLLGLMGASSTTNSSVVNNTSKTYNNQVIVNTTSPTFDVNSINEALGGDLY